MNRALWSSAHRQMASVTHMLLVDFGKLGQSFAETEPGQTFDSAIGALASYDMVVAVWKLDEAEGTLRDVTSDVADYLARQDWDTLCPSERDICERHGKAPADDVDEPLDGHAHQRRELETMGHYS